MFHFEARLVRDVIDGGEWRTGATATRALVVTMTETLSSGKPLALTTLSLPSLVGTRRERRDGGDQKGIGLALPQPDLGPPTGNETIRPAVTETRRHRPHPFFLG